MKKNNSGFSLVELIIVIAIMAVLIGVLAPQFIKYVERSRESTDLQNIEEIKTAMEAYVADSEGLTANASIAIPAGGGSMTLTTITTTELADYGITANSLKMKSKKWAAFTWTYDKTKYSWSCSPEANTVGADYFFADGSGKTS